MDDFVINVRQISQYAGQRPSPGDLVLVQQGGLGGAYISSTTYDLVNGALSGGGPLVSNGQISAPQFILPATGWLSWGVDSPGMGGALTFLPAGGWSFQYAQTGGVQQLMQLRPTGDMQLLFGTLKVARDPFEPFEVATRNFVQNNTVASFNGRIGEVNLTSADVYAELCLDGPIATQPWVNTTICAAIPSFVNQNAFVFTWNGRVGDVCLTLQDVEQAFFSQPGTYPTAPSPALGDASTRIATTAFVDESLEEWANAINNSWNAADFELLNIMQTQYAPLNSPQFTGVPTAPMPPLGSQDATIPTTAWVMQHITGAVTGVVSFNTRTGAVVFTAADLNSVNGATLNSPAFTGTPTAPLAPAADNSNKIATTAWVLSELSAISAGVTSFNGRSGIVLFQGSDLTAVGGAMLASPAFSGTPTAPTPTTGTNTTQIATTAFVMANQGVASFNGRTGAVSLQANDVTAVGGALLVSPTFTGVPAAPTAPPNTSTTQLATTAFVMSQLAAANVVTSFNTRTGNVTLTLPDVTGVGGAPLASPALTGTPTAPTPVVTDNSTAIATTAFVRSVAPSFGRGFVNKICNARFAVGRRAQSGTVTNTNTYTVDTWIISTTASTNWAICCAQTGVAPHIGACSLRLTVNSGTAGFGQLVQRIESWFAGDFVNPDGTLPNLTMQFAFYNGTGIALTPQVLLGFPSGLDNYTTITPGGSFSCASVAPGATATVAVTFAQTTSPVNGFQVTIVTNPAVPSGGVVEISNVDLRATPALPVGINNNPPPPELRNINDEVMLTARYIQGYGNVIMGGAVANFSSVQWSMPIAPNMRVTPTVLVGNLSLAGAANVGTFVAESSQVIHATMQATATASLAGGLMSCNLLLSAEL